jgi:hypothetical protein
MPRAASDESVRAALKILVDADGIELVAVNDIADAENLATS